MVSDQFTRPKGLNIVLSVACAWLQVLKYFWDLASLDEVVSAVLEIRLTLVASSVRKVSALLWLQSHCCRLVTRST